MDRATPAHQISLCPLPRLSQLSSGPGGKGPLPVTGLRSWPLMSLQRRVTWSPPSSEGGASPTLVPPGSGVGVGLGPDGLTGRGRSAQPPPSCLGLRGTEAGSGVPATACIRLSERRGSGGPGRLVLCHLGLRAARKQCLWPPPALGSKPAELVLRSSLFL